MVLMSFPCGLLRRSTGDPSEQLNLKTSILAADPGSNTSFSSAAPFADVLPEDRIQAAFDGQGVASCAPQCLADSSRTS
jgi:hypothetical protein